MTGKWLPGLASMAIALMMAAPAGAAESKVYRWVDADGVVHFGDRVPVDQAQHNREVLNGQGVPVDAEKGAVSPEQAALEAEAERAARAKAEAEAAEAARDAILLNTYLSVAEIESLRNQRAEMIDGQIQITQLYLESLQTKLAKLQKDAARFRPYNPDPDAPPIHQNLAKELSDTMNSIILYEKNLDDAKSRKNELVTKFASDIDRFRYLKGLD